jgi:glucuronokinase
LTARLTFSDVDCFKPVNDAWACASVVSRRKKGVLDLTLLLEATREIASMRIIRQRAHARAGLLGNPSDGYHGKTLSFIVRNFYAEIVLYDWETLEILPSKEDRGQFASIHELVHDVALHGYYGGVRLIKATIKRFADFCAERTRAGEPGYVLGNQTFAIRYTTNIPRQVGLAGSSAIIVATLKALMDFYRVKVPKTVLPSLALSVERRELGIAAGLQDRVIQVYEGLVFMDFSTSASAVQCGLECGSYDELDPHLLPPVYIAYTREHSEPTEALHLPLRARYDAGDAEVRQAMQVFAQLAADGRDALLTQDFSTLASLINRNFDLRRSICDLQPAHVRMIEIARQAGASAKYCGSGGAIVGTYPDPQVYARLVEDLGRQNCTVLRPNILGGD